MWTSLDIGIKFDRPTNIRAQLDKIANGGKPKPSLKPTEPSDLSRRPSHLGQEAYSQTSNTADEVPATDHQPPTEAPLDHAARFSALKSFYKNQLATTTTNNDPSLSSISNDFSYTSPASLTRILNLYSNAASFLPKRFTKPTIMREALYPSEGLLLPPHCPNPATTTAPQIASQILTTGFSSTTTLSQRHFQTSPSGGNPSARFVCDLRPMPAPLTSKRAKRCKECRHILVKPEAKPSSTRYRIRLLALSYIPHVSLKPLPGTSVTSTSTTTTTTAPSPPIFLGSDVILEPGRPTQWILTMRNPLFDAVKVSIATPAVVPGRYGHRVTILCPQFEIGPDSDVWDEALGSKMESVGAAGMGVKGANGGGLRKRERCLIRGGIGRVSCWRLCR